MAGPNNSYIKKQKTEKRLKKRHDKENKKKIRKENSPGGSFENMIAYVDKWGNITSEPPEVKEADKLEDSAEKEKEAPKKVK
jgi:S-adenosylmethionine hydrolase